MDIQSLNCSFYCTELSIRPKKVKKKNKYVDKKKGIKNIKNKCSPTPGIEPGPLG